MIASCLENRRLSESFIRSVITYSVCFNNSSVFDKVYKILPNEKLRVIDGKLDIHKNSMNFLDDDELKELYISNRERYWDECFDTLRKYVGGVLNLGAVVD